MGKRVFVSPPLPRPCSGVSIERARDAASLESLGHPGQGCPMTWSFVLFLHPNRDFAFSSKTFRFSERRSGVDCFSAARSLHLTRHVEPADFLNCPRPSEGRGERKEREASQSEERVSKKQPIKQARWAVRERREGKARARARGAQVGPLSAEPRGRLLPAR